MRPSALVIAHPGHEVRIFGWYEQARPHVFILTAGSRHGQVGRFPISRQLAGKTGTTVAAQAGRYRDREIYGAILTRDVVFFSQWAARLGDDLVALDPGLVVIDGWQMYNVAHDLVHAMARVAVADAERRLGHAIEIADYEVVPPSFAAPFARGREAFRVELDDAALRRKRAAVDAYPDLRAEADEVVAVEGIDAQQTEIFRIPPGLGALAPPSDASPPYEKFGAERVAAGIYSECIRWKRHVRPIVAAILDRRPCGS